MEGLALSMLDKTYGRQEFQVPDEPLPSSNPSYPSDGSPTASIAKFGLMFIS